MHCYMCTLLTNVMYLNEHDAAKWLTKNELDNVIWSHDVLNIARECKPFNACNGVWNRNGVQACAT